MTRKVFDFMTTPDYLYYNRLNWHMRHCATRISQSQKDWLATCCEHFCIIDIYDNKIWFESESDAIQWDVTHS